MIGTFMIVLDFFIVNVALSSIQTDLHASASAIEWVVAGYGLTFASFLIVSGRVGDHVGRRRLFSIGLSLFVVASIACGLAPNAGLLVGARLVQGAAGAMISPNALAILGLLYAGADRMRAISVYGITLGLAAVGGQLIGGLLIAWNIAGLGWRAIFFLNVPLGLAALILARRLVPETRSTRTSRLDPLGITLVTLGLTALVLPLVEGPQLGWPMWTWSTLALALLLLVVLAAHEARLNRHGGVPLIDPALFRRSSFTVGLVA
jgi:MFS family permease